MPERKRQSRNPQATRRALLDAANLEFEESGFDQTNTNRIAARAGFAPQTFYRHFKDKLEIFRAAYDEWIAQEFSMLATVDSAQTAADVLIARHRETLKFRRILRTLSVTDPQVRTARAKSRETQIETLCKWRPSLKEQDFGHLAARLLMVERLADAISEGELTDLGVSQADAQEQLTQLIHDSFDLPLDAK